MNKISKDYLNTEDELTISSLIPMKTNIHTFSLGKSLVCHYSYFTTFDGLVKFSHILQTYKNISDTYFK